MPLDEAIAPEARDQAFGRNNNIEEKESRKGIFSDSQSEMIINRRLSNREITDKQGIACLDKMVGNCFAIFSKKDIRNDLTEDKYEKLVDDYENSVLPELTKEEQKKIKKAKELKEVLDDFMAKKKDLKEFEEELKKNKDMLTPGQVGES